LKVETSAIRRTSTTETTKVGGKEGMKRSLSDFAGPLHIDKIAAKRLVVVRALNAVPEDANLRVEVIRKPLDFNVDFDLFFDNYVGKEDLLYEDNGETVILSKESALQLMGSTLSVSKNNTFTLKTED